MPNLMFHKSPLMLFQIDSLLAQFIKQAISNKIKWVLLQTEQVCKVTLCHRCPNLRWKAYKKRCSTMRSMKRFAITTKSPLSLTYSQSINPFISNPFKVDRPSQGTGARCLNFTFQTHTEKLSQTTFGKNQVILLGKTQFPLAKEHLPPTLFKREKAMMVKTKTKESKASVIRWNLKLGSQSVILPPKSTPGQREALRNRTTIFTWPILSSLEIKIILQNQIRKGRRLRRH